MSRTKTEVLTELLDIFNSFGAIDDEGNKLDTSDGSFPYDALAAVALYVAGDSNANIVGLENQLETNRDESFLHLAKTDEGIINGAVEVGIYRKEDVYSSGYVTFSGTPNSVVAQGLIVASGDLNYITQESKIIPSTGIVDVLVKAEKGGLKYNVPANLITKKISAIPNVTAISNADSFTNGADIESIEKLRKRALKVKRNPPHHGTKTYYELLAKNELKQIYPDIIGVDGVGGVRVLPRTPTVGSVTVYISNSVSEIPSTQLISDVQEVMDEYKIETAEIIVSSAILKEIDISANLILAEGVDITNVYEILRIKIRDHLRTVFDKGKIQVSNTGIFEDDYKFAVSWSEIGNILFDEEGVVGYDNLLINGESKTLILLEQETPILKTLALV